MSRIALLCALAASWPVQSAHAFSDAAAFGDAAIDGGGGGRWFTGTPADGYGCDACHVGREGSDVGVRGLPLDGYVPGASYDIIVSWPLWVEHAGIVAELTDERRLGAGTLWPPELMAVSDQERCRDENGILGPLNLTLHQAEGARALASGADCSAHSLHFRWIAPSPAVGTIWFGAGIVQSDAQQDTAGDGTTMISRALPPIGSGGYVSQVAAGCGIAAAPMAPMPWTASALVALTLLHFRKGRRRPRPRETTG